ncbi:SMI1/KNR4 family protein [Streptomyces sp. NPDC048219]|uniref:SMI1/KNR4 family protein n=1 Tax=unclassified Streptomyces TaxID=2593676 RepID=UPI0034427383
MDRLLKLSGPALSDEQPAPEDWSSLGSVGAELHQLLTRRNGFYAFESALHVFPSAVEVRGTRSFGDWNEGRRWLDCYGALRPELSFFAEDVFGGQFGTDGKGVYAFNPETAALTPVGDSLADWAHRVLDDYAYLTGYPVAHEWQSLHGALPAGHRLIPRIPFVFGGTYSAENMVLVESTAAMRYSGGIALSISKMSDGVQLKFDPSVVGRLRCAADRPEGLGMCRCFEQCGTDGVSL